MKTAAFFDKFSKEYASQDRYRYLYYRWLTKNIINEVDREDCDIIDVGTGTGNLAVRLATKYPKSRILGVDISKGMVNEAKAKCKRMRITNVRFKISPVEKLRIGRIDFAVSALTFHHVKDKAQVISNIYDRLSENGKLVIGDWFEPTKQYKKEIGESRRKNPKMAKKFDKSWKDSLKGMSRKYGTEHPKEYPVSQTDLAAILKKAGFREPRILKSLLPNFAIVVGTK
jgi:ubiquinone/menaquinone biosynthesis C-methylase UbiE